MRRLKKSVNSKTKESLLGFETQEDALAWVTVQTYFEFITPQKLMKYDAETGSYKVWGSFKKKHVENSEQA